MGSFRLDYRTALDDAVAWSHVLMKANISLTTLPSAEINSGKPDFFDGDSQDEAEEESIRNVGMSKEDREALEQEKAQEGVNPNSDDDDADEEESTTPPQKADTPRFLRKRSHRVNMLDPDLIAQEMF